MSDLLAPVLCEIKDEAETFWCFVGLMQRAFFVCTPTDNDIDKNLVSSVFFRKKECFNISYVYTYILGLFKRVIKGYGSQISCAFRQIF